MKARKQALAADVETVRKKRDLPKPRDQWSLVSCTEHRVAAGYDVCST
jgi:hypothetical protein